MSPEQYVSVVEPLTPAIERVKTVLFRPFDLGKWFVIGFTAWLAYLGQGGGGNGGGGSPPGGGHGQANPGQMFNDLRNFAAANIAWLIPLAVFLVFLAIAIWLLVVWLSSRGRFMFLHCVALNKAEVKVPWHKFSKQGNSLFAFRLILHVIGIFGVLCPMVFVGWLIFAMVQAGQAAVGGIVGAAMLFMAFVAIAICLAVVALFTKDFVVPIMFMRTQTCTAAWGDFMQILGANKGRFIVYVLFKIVITMAIGVMTMLIVCATCCCAACILAIPYIGTVLYLPILVFDRAYPLYYLQQYGPSYDVLTAVEPQPQPATY